MWLPGPSLEGRMERSASCGSGKLQMQSCRLGLASGPGIRAPKKQGNIIKQTGNNLVWKGAYGPIRAPTRRMA